MGIIPDTMIMNIGGDQPWWSTSKHKAQEMDAALGYDEWAKAAGLDFEVAAAISGYSLDGGVSWNSSPHRRTIVNKTTGCDLGWFTKRYVIHQPRELQSFFEKFVLADERFKLATMGSMKGGAMIWALAEFMGHGGDVVGDAHKLYALIVTSYNGMWATSASATAIRAVCQNTIEATVFGKGPVFRVPHNASFDAIKQERAARALADIAGQFDEYKAFAEKLHAIAMTREETLAFLAKLAGVDEVTADDINGHTKGIMSDMVDSLSETLREESNDGFNAWTALNTVTRYVDHTRGTKRNRSMGETTGQARLFSANFGSGAGLKAKAAKLLLPDMRAVAMPSMETELVAA